MILTLAQNSERAARFIGRPILTEDGCMFKGRDMREEVMCMDSVATCR